MTRRRRFLLFRPRKRVRLFAAIVLGLGTAAALVTGSAAENSNEPKPARVTILNLTAKSAVGNFCTDHPTGHGSGYVVCADKPYPLHPKGRLPAPPHATVRIDVRKTAGDVSGVLIHSDGQHAKAFGPTLHATPTDADRRHWKLRLPGDLQGATHISLLAHFPPRGDANYWAGLRPVRHWP